MSESDKLFDEASDLDAVFDAAPDAPQVQATPDAPPVSEKGYLERAMENPYGRLKARLNPEKQAQVDISTLSGLSPFASRILGATKGFGVGVNALPGYVKGKLGLGPEVMESPLDVAGREFDKTKQYYDEEIATADAAMPKVMGAPIPKLAASLALPGPGAGATLPMRMLQTGLMGAYQTGSTDPAELAKGAGVSMGVTGGLAGLGRLGGKAGDYLSKQAALSAFGSPTASALKKVGAVSPRQVSEVAGELRDSGLIKPFGTSGDVAEAIGERLKLTGEEVGEAISKVDADALKAGRRLDMKKFSEAMNSSVNPRGPQNPIVEKYVRPVRSDLELISGAPIKAGESGFSQAKEILTDIGERGYDKNSSLSPVWKQAQSAGREYLHKEAAVVAGPEAKSQLEAANQAFSKTKRFEDLVRVSGGPEIKPPGLIEFVGSAASQNPAVLGAGVLSGLVRQRLPSAAMKPLQYTGEASEAFGQSGLPMAAGRAAYAASAGKPKNERDEEAVNAFITQSPQ